MLQTLINYTALADKKIIDVFLSAGKSIPEAEHLFSHILNAQHIWVKRVFKEEEEYDRFQIHSVAAFEDIHLKNIEYLFRTIATKDLDEQIIYKDSRGNEYQKQS